MVNSDISHGYTNCNDRECLSDEFMCYERLIDKKKLKRISNIIE